MMGIKLGKGGIANSYGFVAIVISLIAIASVALYFSTRGRTTGPGENNIGIELGQTAPDFTLTDIDGNTHSLSDYRGHVVIMDLMATWCGPCVTQMGYLKQAFDNYNGQGVVITSIDIDPSESNEVIRQFKERYGDNWIFASGPDVGVTYGVVYIPTLYIIDQQGRIAYKGVGVTPFSTLATEINKLSQHSSAQITLQT